MNNNNKENKGFYLALYTIATLFLLIAFGVTILHSSNDSQNDEPIASVDKSNVEPLTQTTTKAQTKSEPKTETTTTKPTTKSTSTTSSTENKSISLFTDNDEMMWPVSGQIVMDYSPETAVYDKTLDQYKTTNSICISAPLGEVVCAGADGVVSTITKDNEKGVTVSIDHGNGYMSTYSQLQDNLSISEGQTVYKGDKIGTIAKPTKYSAEIGPHLEFSVSKDDTVLDPKLILASLD